MKFLILFSVLLISVQAFACIVEFEIKRTDTEEQKKGPLKKTVVVEEAYALNGDKIISVEARELEYDSASISIFSAPNNEVKLKYDKELFKNIVGQWKRCKGT